jgi:predicted dehydrogenase
MKVTKQTYNVGLIGAGTIAASRPAPLRAAGLEVTAVSTRAGSKRVHEFAATHHIPKVYESWQEMLGSGEKWDAFVISTWPDGTPDVVAEAVKRGVPVLVEKPVAWNSARLRELCAVPHDNVIVGYNRRFYDSVQEARKEICSGPPLIAQVTIPTDVPVPAEYDGTGRYMQQFYESVSALGLDLTRYVMGDLKVENVRRLKNPAGNNQALAAILSTERGDVVQVTCNWGTAANYSLTLNRPNRRFELLPFEIASVYEGMEVHPPSDDYPIRRYMPKLLQRVVLAGPDLEHKPGFYGEALALKAMIDGGEPPEFTARLEDALAVTTLCEELTGVKLGNTNPSTYH